MSFFRSIIGSLFGLCLLVGLVYRSFVWTSFVFCLSFVCSFGRRHSFGLSFVLRLDDVHIRLFGLSFVCLDVVIWSIVWTFFGQSFVCSFGRPFVLLDVVWAIVCSFGRWLGDRLFV